MYIHIYNVYIHIYIYITYIYIYICNDTFLHNTSLFENVTKYKVKDETFKISLYFEKIYTTGVQLKKIQRAKSRFIRNMKNLLNSQCTSKTRECQKVKNLIENTPFKLHHLHQGSGVLTAPSNI